MTFAAQLKASDIVDAVSADLDDNDPPFIRYSERLLRRFVEDGQRVICTLKPGVYTKKHTVRLEPGVLQSIPATAYSFIEALRNRGDDGVSQGKVPTFFVKRDLDLYNPSWMVSSASMEIDEFTFEESDPYHFWVNPPAAENVHIEILCNEIPPSIDSSDTVLVLKSIFYQPLYDYTMYRALSVSNESGDDIKAQEHASNAMQLLGLKSDTEKMTFYRDTKNKEV
jgi:hypothetical protein